MTALVAEKDSEIIVLKAQLQFTEEPSTTLDHSVALEAQNNQFLADITELKKNVVEITQKNIDGNRVTLRRIDQLMSKQFSSFS